jgi:hypothetical protein
VVRLARAAAQREQAARREQVVQLALAEGRLARAVRALPMRETTLATEVPAQSVQVEAAAQVEAAVLAEAAAQAEAAVLAEAAAQEEAAAQAEAVVPAEAAVLAEA